MRRRGRFPALRIGIAAALLIALACAGAPPVAEGPPAARLRGLDFSASIHVKEEPPQRLEGEVRITNRGQAPETLVFSDGCPVRLRVYEVQRSRVAPVWEGPVTCESVPIAVAIAPGETEFLSIPPTRAPDILRDQLPEGQYRITVWLAPDDRIIEIEAGQVELTTSR